MIAPGPRFLLCICLAGTIAAADATPESIVKALDRMPALQDSAYSVARNAVLRAGNKIVPWLEEQAKTRGRLGECAAECLLYLTRPKEVAAWEADPSNAPVPWLAGKLQESVGYADSSGGGPAEKYAVLLGSSGDPAAAVVLCRHLTLRDVGDECEAGLVKLGVKAIPALRATVDTGIAWLETERPALRGAERKRLAAKGYRDRELEDKVSRYLWRRDRNIQCTTGCAARILGRAKDRESVPRLRRLLVLEDYPVGFGAAFALVAMGDDQLGAVVEALEKSAAILRRQTIKLERERYAYLRTALRTAGEQAKKALQVHSRKAGPLQEVLIEGLLADIDDDRVTGRRHVVSSCSYGWLEVSEVMPAPKPVAKAAIRNETGKHREAPQTEDGMDDISDIPLSSMGHVATLGVGGGDPTPPPEPRPPAVVLEALAVGVNVLQRNTWELNQNVWLRGSWRTLPHADEVLAAVVAREQMPFGGSGANIPDSIHARITERGEPNLVAACRQVVLDPSYDWRRKLRLKFLVRMPGDHALKALRTIHETTAGDEALTELHELAAFGIRLREEKPITLAPLLAKDDVFTREAVIRVLGAARDKGTRDAVAALLNTDANTTDAPARCLLAMGDPRGIKPLLAHLVTEPEPSSRRRWQSPIYRDGVKPILALGTNALPVLKKLSDSSDLRIRVAAAACRLRIEEPELAATYDEAEARVRRTMFGSYFGSHLRRAIPESRYAAAGARLTELAGKKARPLIEEAALLRNNRTAVHALGSLGDRRSIPVLVHSHPAGATAVGHALKKMGEAGRTAAKRVPQPDPFKARFGHRSGRAGAATRALFDFDDPEAVPRLIESLERTEGDAKAHRHQLAVLLAAAKSRKPDPRLLDPLLTVLDKRDGHVDARAIMRVLKNFRDPRLADVAWSWMKHYTGSGHFEGIELLTSQRDDADHCATARELLDDDDPTLRALAAEYFRWQLFNHSWQEQPADWRSSALDRLLELLADEEHAWQRTFSREPVRFQVRDVVWGSLAAAVRRDFSFVRADDAERARILPALATALAGGRFRWWYHHNAPNVFLNWQDEKAGKHLLAGFRVNGKSALGAALARMPYPPALPELTKHLDDREIVGTLDDFGAAAVPHLITALTAVGPTQRDGDRESVLRAAIQSLGKIGEAATPAWDTLLSYIDNPKLRVDAAQALYRIDAKRARTILEAVVIDPSTDPIVVQRLARVLTGE